MIVHVKRFVAILVALAMFSGGMEFATDYAEALEGTTLVVLPDGHHAEDGHDPADHGAPCDNCHFGGIHLLAFIQTPIIQAGAASAAHTPWLEPVPAQPALAPPSQPPIA